MGHLRTSFLIAVIVLVLICLGLLITFALPRPEFELIGTTKSYPARSEPYDLRETGGYYLVNTGFKILALNPRTPRRAGCWIIWDEDKGQFRDPCVGTSFDLTGRYESGPLSPPLQRYRVRTENESIWVSTNSVDENDDEY